MPFFKQVDIVHTVVFSLCVCREQPFQARPPVEQECESVDRDGRYYRKYKHFNLAFAEFSERGNLFDAEQIDDVLSRINVHTQAPSGAITDQWLQGF